MNDAMVVRISLADQQLVLQHGDQVRCQFAVSTAVNGANERDGSGGTPRGWHRIKMCIGADCPLGTVFRGRRLTGECYSPQLAARYPERDWILTRILWLTGLESGLNRGGMVDTLRRLIYIHGCPDHEPMGVPGSHGCIRMRNTEIVELFAQVKVGTLVQIIAESLTETP